MCGQCLQAQAQSAAGPPSPSPRRRRLGAQCIRPDDHPAIWFPHRKDVRAASSVSTKPRTRRSAHAHYVPSLRTEGILGAATPAPLEVESDKYLHYSTKSPARFVA
jgi:hypothetical protein